MTEPMKYTLLKDDQRLAVYNEMLAAAVDMKRLQGTCTKLCQKCDISDSTVRESVRVIQQSGTPTVTKTFTSGLFKP